MADGYDYGAMADGEDREAMENEGHPATIGYGDKDASMTGGVQDVGLDHTPIV
jgi:hypothetical protein